MDPNDIDWNNALEKLEKKAREGERRTIAACIEHRAAGSAAEIAEVLLEVARDVRARTA